MFMVCMLTLVACSSPPKQQSPFIELRLDPTGDNLSGETVSATRGETLTFIATLISENEVIPDSEFVWSFTSMSQRSSTQTPGGSTVNENGRVTISADEQTATPLRLSVSELRTGVIGAYVYINVNNTLANIFDSEALAQAVADQLSGVEIHHPIELSDLSDIVELDASDVGIASLRGIEYLTNLTSLDLSDNHIEDLESLETLAKLARLDLRNNQISDTSSLSYLQSLIKLDLSDNHIEDLESLETLAKLARLDLRNNQISDISSLSHLQSLIKLDLSDNHIEDLESLETLAKLARLDLRNNQISDISSLSHLQSLIKLDLSDNHIEDLRPLGKLSLMLAASGQTIQLEDTFVGLATKLSLFLPNGEPVDLQGLEFTFEESLLIWQTSGDNNAANWETTVDLDGHGEGVFSGTFYQNVELALYIELRLDEADNDLSGTTISAIGGDTLKFKATLRQGSDIILDPAPEFEWSFDESTLEDAMKTPGGSTVDENGVVTISAEEQAMTPLRLNVREPRAGVIDAYVDILFTGNSGVSNLWVRSIRKADLQTDSPHDIAPYMIQWLEIGDTYYLMIPNSADVNNLRVYFEADFPVFVDEVELISGEYTDVFSNRADGIATLTSGGKEQQVIVMQSSEIPTMFIQTDSGSLDFVNANRNNREPAQILLIDEHGEVNFNGRADRFNGRGNSTWSQPKRPYNIRLAGGSTNGPAELLGMGPHRHWALLANDFDNSHIRNTMSHELANEVGMEFAMQVRPVDVYINNQYHGLYLLSERVRIDTVVPIRDLEAATQAVNPGLDFSDIPRSGQSQPIPGTFRYFDIPNNPTNISDGYLIEWEFSNRYNNDNADPSAFVTSRGQAIMVGAPEFASRAQMEYISSFVQEMEDAMHSPTGINSQGRHFREYICIESFAKMYVFMEFVADQDAGVTSFYAYKDSGQHGDELLRAAPPWDFDLTFGYVWGTTNVRNPNQLFVNSRSVFNLLWQHEEFQQAIRRIWNEDFAPVVGNLTADNATGTNRLQSIREYEANIAKSAQMEWVRWGIGRRREQAIVVNEVFNFTQARINFLNSEWGD